MSQGGKAGGGPTRLGGSGAGGSGSYPPAGASSSSAELDAGASASMSMGSDASMIGEVLDNRYKIVKKLGEGGMGEVYAAEHVHIAKKVAIKLLRREVVSNEEAVSRFRQEARSASTIGHRNIIGIDDFGQLKDGRIYLCMEYLSGEPLNDMIMQPQPNDRLLNILIQTGHGLAAAHAKGIVHRDMKPENIFVTTTPGGEDIPKLLDFGIAKVGGQDGSNNQTKTGTIFGTPYYMAPEQALGQNVDARVDIYALGVIAYEVFSGSLPFMGESFMGVLTQHITTEPEPVAQRAAKAGKTLPPGLPELIARAMAKDPERRFRTMDDMVGGLVDIYRHAAGPGMSSYLEAAPRASSSQPSVGPPQMPVRPAAATAGGNAMLATIADAGPPGGAAGLAAPGNAAMPATLIATGGALPQRSGPMGMPPQSGPMGVPPQSGPMGVPPGGPMGGPHRGPPMGGSPMGGSPMGGSPMGGPPMGGPQPYQGPGSGPYAQLQPYPPAGHPGSSGMYANDSQIAMRPRRSKGPLIAIIIAAVVVIGAVIAMVAIPKQDDDVVAAGAIDAAVAVPPTPIDAGTGGSAPIVDAGALVENPDAAARAIDAAGVTSPVNTVAVMINSTTRTAEVYDNGAPIGRVPQNVLIAAGEDHEITVRAAGFIDEVITVDGREPRIDVKLKRAAGVGAGTGSGPGTGHGSGPGTGHGTGSGPGTGSGSVKPPPAVDCDANPTDPRCGL